VILDCSVGEVALSGMMAFRSRKYGINCLFLRAPYFAQKRSMSVKAKPPWKIPSVNTGPIGVTSVPYTDVDGSDERELVLRGTAADDAASTVVASAESFKGLDSESRLDDAEENGVRPAMTERRLGSRFRPFLSFRRSTISRDAAAGVEILLSLLSEWERLLR
jgi:hypothetical protein